MKKAFKNHKFQICKLDFFVGILFGIILSLSATFMFMSKSINFDAFFDIGNYCEIDSLLSIQYSDGTKLLSAREIELTGSESSLTFMADEKNSFYKYLNFYLSDITNKGIDSVILFYNQEGNLMQSKPVTLQNGKNIIVLPKETVSKAVLQFKGQNGKKLKIDKIESTEKIYETSLKKGITYFCITFLIYVIFVMWLFLKILNKLDVAMIQPLILAMQEIWMKMSRMFDKFSPQISEMQRKVIRVACFLWIMLDQQYMIKFGKYSDPEVYRFYIARICIVLLILSLTNISSNMKIMNWNQPIIKAWVVLSLCMCISDFIISKRLMYTGYWQLLFFGFFFWTWSNMENPVDILRDLVFAFEIIFILSCFYCFAFERLSTVYYVGTMKNSNTFGEYMAIAIAVITGLIFEELYKKRKWNRLIMLIVELLIAFYFLWISQCRTAMLTTIICCVLLLLGVFKNRRHKNFLGKFLLSSLIFALLLFPIWRGVNYVISHNLGQVVAEEDTIFDWDKATETVMAASLQDSKLVHRFTNVDSVNTLTSGRISIYRTYLMKSNLLGHPGKEKLFGREYGAHNSALMINYRYGVIAVIPYLILWILYIMCSFCYSVIKIREKGSYALLVTSLIITVSLIGLLDDQEHPMAYLTWFLFYFFIGFFFKDVYAWKKGLHGKI